MEHFDKILYTHYYWQDLAKRIAKTRGEVEAQARMNRAVHLSKF